MLHPDSFFEMNEIVPLRVAAIAPDKNDLSVVTAVDEMMRCAGRGLR